MQKTIMMLGAILLVVPLDALDITQRCIKRIKMIQKYVATKLTTKGFTEPLKKDGAIPVAWMGMVGALMAGVGIKGFITLRTSQKNEEDKKKEILPGIVAEDPSLVSTSSRQSQPTEQVQTNDVSTDKEETIDDTSTTGSVSVPFDEDQFPEPSNENYDLAGAATVEFNVEGASVSNIKELTPVVVESPTIIDPETNEEKPIEKRYVVKKEAVYKRPTAITKQGRRKADGKAVDLNSLGIENEGTMKNTPLESDPMNSPTLMQVFMDRIMSKDKKSKKTGEKPVQRAQSMDICFSNDPINKEMTEECRESLLKDPLNQFSNDQINNIVQVVGNKDNVTLDISIEDIPEGKQGIFYKLLLNYIEAKN